MEAAAFATAGLFIENSCAGDGIIDGVNGYLAANNPEAFASKIIEAIKDKEKLRQVGLKPGKMFIFLGMNVHNNY